MRCSNLSLSCTKRHQIKFLDVKYLFQVNYQVNDHLKQQKVLCYIVGFLNICPTTCDHLMHS